MKILGIYNIKGGVGKTAAAVNLGHLAAQAGLRTLIWDLDPQGASTFYLRVKPKVRRSGKLIRGQSDVADAVKGSDYPLLDLLPSDLAYRNLDLMLGDSKKPTARLAKLLDPLADDYDLVLLDCPPSISLVSENVFSAADALLLPTIPTTLSLRTLEQLLDFLAGQGIDTPVDVFYSMVDRRKRLHQAVMADDPDPRCRVLGAAIPYASEVERMGLERRPVTDFASRSPAGLAYLALWQEVRERLGGLPVVPVISTPL
jgi:cellulose biosynthesis protein BcsQ